MCGVSPYRTSEGLLGRSLLYVEARFEGPVLACKQLFIRLNFLRNEGPEAAKRRPSWPKLYPASYLVMSRLISSGCLVENAISCTKPFFLLSTRTTRRCSRKLNIARYLLCVIVKCIPAPLILHSDIWSR